MPRPGGRPGSAGTGLTQDGRRSSDSHSSIHPAGIKGWGCKGRTVCTQLQSHRCPSDWPPWLLCRSHPPSASSAGKESACSVPGVLTSAPPAALHTPRGHHVPKPTAVPGWKRVTVGPILQMRDSDLERRQGRRGSPRKEQNKTGLEARLVEPQPSSSELGGVEKKKPNQKATFNSERGCLCSAFLAVP